jgi:hypothetical protein
VTDINVRRVDFGYFIRPPEETGTGQPRVEPCDTATAFTADMLAVRARADGVPEPLPVAPEWMDRLRRLDPRRVVFAHDNAVWTP